MLDVVKNTFKHSLIYSLGNIGIKIVGLILIPVYTNPVYLSIDDYGAFAILESLLAILSSLLPGSMGQGLMRWYYIKNDRDYQKAVFFNTLIFVIVVQILFLAICYPLRAEITSLLFANREYTYVVVLTLFSTSLNVIMQHILNLARIQQKSLLFALVNIYRLLISLGLILFFIIGKGRGLNGIWEAQLISYAATLLILLPVIFRNCKLEFHFDQIKEMMKYGFPFVLASVSGIILAFADKYMLNIMDGLDKTAVYSLGFRVSNAVKIIVATSIGFAIAPARMKMISNPVNLRFFSKNLTYIGFVMMFFVLLISLFALEGLKIFTSDVIYWEANNIIPFLSMAVLIGVLKDYSSESMLILKKTKSIALFVFLTGLFNVGMNYLLIPRFDIYGASVSTLSSQLLLWILIYRYSQKMMYIPYELNKILKIILVGCVMLVVGILIMNYPLLWRLLIKFLMIGIFPLILYLWNFYEEIELKTIRRIFHTWRNPKEIKVNLTRLLRNE